MALPSIFHHLKMTDTYFEKKRKKVTKVLASAEFYIWYTYMQNNKYHRTWIFFFLQYFEFFAFAFFLCLLSGHWKLLPVFDL